jgi:formylglycine-generating enzyme required for sulfatase activity
MLEDEISGALWAAVVGGPAEDPALPVAAVSWDEAEAFITALAGKVPSLAPRIPSEEEWDQAAGAVRDAEPAADPPAEILAWWQTQGGEAPSLPELRLALARAGLAVRPRPAAPGVGLRHLGGNLQEWVVGERDGQPVPLLRGGSVVHPAKAQIPATRHEVADTVGEPWVGLRLVIPGSGPGAWPTGLDP